MATDLAWRSAWLFRGSFIMQRRSWRRGRPSFSSRTTCTRSCVAVRAWRRCLILWGLWGGSPLWVSCAFSEASLCARRSATWGGRRTVSCTLPSCTSTNPTGKPVESAGKTHSSSAATSATSRQPRCVSGISAPTRSSSTSTHGSSSSDPSCARRPRRHVTLRARPSPGCTSQRGTRGWGTCRRRGRLCRRACASLRTLGPPRRTCCRRTRTTSLRRCSEAWGTRARQGQRRKRHGA
mmetsp:Transcript_41970/g.102907  ORF Transcript_41970/g.102907 Transcript_41970/m.102907 type:complete len:237 (-) Transcript_41970:408-1118(-)